MNSLQPMIHIHKPLLYVLCAILMAACTTDTTCRKEMDVAMGLTLQADSLNAKGHAVIYTNWDSLTVEALGKNELLIDNGKSVKRLFLPLRPDTTVSAFLMTFHEQTDTLYVAHTPRQYFVSLACGCAIYHTITAAWSSDTRVDSVQIINASVENAVQENLRIYLHE